MKRTKWLLAALCLMAAGTLLSCDNEDYGYYEVEKSLFGEWESDSIATTEPNGIVLYHADIVPSDKHSVSPYRIIVKRKDGQWYLYKRGWMGHRDVDPNNKMEFTDVLNSYGGWMLTVSWLDKGKTKIAVYGDIMFHKISNTSCYDKTYSQDYKN